MELPERWQTSASAVEGRKKRGRRPGLLRALLPPRFTDLYELCGTGGRMGLQLAPCRPVVVLVVVIDVAQQETALCLMDNEPDIRANTDGPEVLVLCRVERVEAHARIRRVDMEIEGGGLYGLLLVAGEAGEAIGEGVGDAELHGASSEV